MTYNHWTGWQIEFLLDGVAAGKSYQKISEGLPFTGRDVTHKHFLLKCGELDKKMSITFDKFANDISNAFCDAFYEFYIKVNRGLNHKKLIIGFEKLNGLNPNKRTTRNQRLNNVRRMNPKFRG